MSKPVMGLLYLYFAIVCLCDIKNFEGGISLKVSNGDVLMCCRAGWRTKMRIASQTCAAVLARGVKLIVATGCTSKRQTTVLVTSLFHEVRSL